MLNPKILSPISKVEEAMPLIKAGTDEFYLGWVLPEWKKKYTLIDSVNARHTDEANLKGFGELSKVVEIAHSNGKKVWLAMNSLFYTQNQLPLVLGQIERAESIALIFSS